MTKNLFAFILLLLISISASAQQYGNEWIDFSLKYLKIAVNKEGLYKISFQDVVSKNLFSGQLDPKKFQLFNKGVEVPIFISGDQDGVFSQGDEIFFYGNKNDASLDKVLYNNPNDLPNNEVSLFTNQNYFFITYNPSKNGKRHQISSLATLGLTPSTYVIAKDRLNFDTNYYPGAYILEAMSLSEYTEGEGYLGTVISKGQSLNYQLNTSNFLNTGYSSSLSLYVAGRSNASSTNTTGKNHHFRVSLDNTTLFDSLYRGYASVRKRLPINVNSNNTNVLLSSVDDLGAVTDFQAPGYLEIKYSRSLNLSGLNSLSFNLDKADTQVLLSFTNLSLANPIIIEKNGTRVYRTSGNNSFVIENATQEVDYYLADQATATKVQLDDIVFKNHAPLTSKNYLIVSNVLLKAGAEAYEQYNQSLSMPTSVVYTDDLYNEFYYGFHHSMALRNYCKYMIEKGITKPEYLLLLGKGYEQSREYLNDDLVPTMGFPASDNMLTSGLNGTDLTPAIATGRIPASSNKEISNYLEKLQVYNNLPDSLWRKNIIHVSGGKSSSENNSFKSYFNTLASIAKDPNFGAHINVFTKNVSDPVTDNITEGIIKETRNGAGLIAFLGHGSSTVTDVSLGTPSELGNADKPVIYLVNGCSTGNAFSETKAYSEQMLFQKGDGAVAWIGTTSEGVASYLNTFSDEYYKNWFKKLYGKSIATGMAAAVGTKVNRSDKLNLAHARQYIFIGDPAIKFFSKSTVDYSLESNNIYLTPTNQNASQEKLKIAYIIKNLGKAVVDSLDLSLTRVFPDKSERIYITKVKPVLNQDTFKFEFDNTGKNTVGTNVVKISLNYNSIISEENKLNNLASYSFFLPGNGVNPTFPTKNSIVSENLILEAEPDNLFSKNLDYAFEIDTITTFDSGFKRRSPNIQADIFPKWAPNVQMIDNKVYFWRVSIQDLSGTEKWSNSQFTFSNSKTNSFSISKKEQLNELGIKLNDMDYDEATGKFSFKSLLFTTNISMRGDDVPVSQVERRLRANINTPVSYTPVESTGVTMVAYNNKKFAEIFSYASPYNSTYGPNIINGYTGQYFFNTNNPTEVDSLVSYLNQVPAGYYVVGLNNYNFSGKSLSNKAKDALRSLGLVKFDLIDNGEPYVFYGIKGGKPGSASEFTADYSSSTPARSQTFRITKDLPYKSTNAYFTTDKIGPAVLWENAEIDYAVVSSDKILYSVIGVDKEDNEQVLILNANQKKINLTPIDANKYPFIKLKVLFKDIDNETPPNLIYIRAKFDLPAEISFNPEFKNDFHGNTLDVGDSLKLNLGISNIRNKDSEDITLKYTITKQDNNSITKTETIPAIKANEHSTLFIKENTNLLAGKNKLKIQIERSNLNDIYNFNNSILYEFEVISDKREPLVDVFFDGRRIINGDIVSPTPIIQISSLDENRYLIQKDTSLIDVYLKNNNDGIFKRISYKDHNLKISEIGSDKKNLIALDYIPEKLPDGTYSLKITAKDVSGNTAANKDLLVDFEVVNEASITNFYPYPNPVVNSMRFVFTLTGKKVPSKIQVQIFSASGKIIREVSKLELGDLKIGNNVSDFVWDGTDQFGDRLANGVYFYRINIEDDDDLKHRSTKNDNKFFKNNTGKIYLLR